MKLETLTLQRIRARPVVVPLRRPIVNRLRTIESWPLILIDLYTIEGVTGRSYLQPYLLDAMRYVVAAVDDLGKRLAGHALAPFDLYNTARKSLAPIGGSQGMSMIAVSGVDMAAWDALAKAAGLPLCSLLGGSVGSVVAYNSSGLWFKDSPQAAAEEAAQLLEEGDFSALKLRLGQQRAGDDLATLDAVQQALGSDVELMIDYSQALDMGEALSRCHMIDDRGLAWIEEPIAQDNLEGCAQLAAQLRTPIQLGENFYGPGDLHRALQARACDFVMPDFMRIGGVSGWLRSASIAGVAGVPISTHLYPEVAAHAMRVAETAHWLEWLDWADPVLQEPFAVTAGQLQIPSKPGIGLHWDEDFVAAHLLH